MTTRQIIVLVICFIVFLGLSGPPIVAMFSTMNKKRNRNKALANSGFIKEIQTQFRRGEEAIENKKFDDLNNVLSQIESAKRRYRY